ncbi:nucleotide sugar dehydrogenase [Candidatus Woesearchaeota archaeon]|nr:nucleotide sugar dehydrogenase [Candidatus Woesearchaeota archaeon]MBT3538422.1 nucleotide sugar dehydrogenase [Candidatus Woesearchaeota archaeon]MBT4696872.1 nucleotide sugar dehydrogenase [Candidatus Woesearchaeota archaeon]MBT7106122.1 nucleotide sugar dehydrogenase [Candidatus Woesearchaeota archaeon]MBT7930980.1 nucleotide sugar dehydrogenase [Candidatus Woesearchaeota archaeon]
MATNRKICIVGLGYVGLPLAVAFGRKTRVMGFDINEKKIQELKQDHDSMGEVEEQELKQTDITYTANPEDIRNTDFIIVAVPTPIDAHNKPDLTPMIKASETIAKNLAKGSIVVFESTVYPGVTEEICVPVLEKHSNLKCGDDFKVGYSPERINPGDKEHTIDKIIKIVSGQDEETLNIVADVYETIVTAGVHKAPNIKTAEAAKVIENIQRDLNIGLVNELALIFQKVGISTFDVIEAASTKWNFHKYKPGLVGGHCIGVDPYYLVYKAEELGYHPQIITAGRSINDNMHKNVAELIIKGLIKAGKAVKNSKILILGLTFKENITDPRNSRAKQLIEELKDYEVDIVACDPWLNDELVMKEFKVENIPFERIKKDIDGIILVTAHDEFKEISLEQLKEVCVSDPVLVDIKGLYDRKNARDLGFSYASY